VKPIWMPDKNEKRYWMLDKEPEESDFLS